MATGSRSVQIHGDTPHVATLHEIRQVGEAQKSMLAEFLDGMDGLLNQRNIQGGVMTEERLRAIVMEATSQLRNQVHTLVIPDGMDGTAQAAEIRADAQHRTVYNVYMHGGRFSKLPATWDFPASGALHCWRHWNLGNRAEGTPPLKIMEINDVKHVDRLPLQENEKQRPPRKNTVRPEVFDEIH